MAVHSEELAHGRAVYCGASLGRKPNTESVALPTLRAGFTPQFAAGGPIFALHIHDQNVYRFGRSTQHFDGDAGDFFDQFLLLLQGAAFEQFDVVSGHGDGCSVSVVGRIIAGTLRAYAGRAACGRRNPIQHGRCHHRGGAPARPLGQAGAALQLHGALVALPTQGAHVGWDWGGNSSERGHGFKTAVQQLRGLRSLD